MAEASPELKRKRAFKQIAPDAVFELLSPSDELHYTVSNGRLVLVPAENGTIEVPCENLALSFDDAGTTLDAGPA